MPQYVNQEDLIRNAGLAFDCDFPTQVQCSTWHEGTEIQQDAFPSEHGIGFNLIVYRQALVSWETDELEEPDEQQLLQRSWSRFSNSATHQAAETQTCLNAAAPPFSPQDKNIQGPDTDWPKPPDNVLQNHIKINMKDVIDTQDWLDSHFTLPCFDIEAQLLGNAHWHPASLEWIQMHDWFAYDQPVDKIRIYYDGSFVKANNAIGFASVAFVQIAGKWAFAGALSGRDTEADETASYKAELNAALITLKFLYDLVKVQHDVFSATPACELVFDSLTVGNQTSGLWKSTRAILDCHLARSLLRLCETRFAMRCEHFFSPGHSGEPGNELADTLAWCAAHGQPLQDWSTFLHVALKGKCVGLMEWAWMLHTDWTGAELHNMDWICPQRPSTTPVSSALPSMEPAETHMSVQLEFKLRFATCNVLTLRSEVGKHGSLTAGVEGPARLEWILKSFDDLGIHVFALQETRIRKVKQSFDDRYILIKSQATRAGQYGMIIGLSKRHPFAAQTQPGVSQEKEQLFFQADDYTIIESDPRILVVKVQRNNFRCILTAAHAPHTGATLQEIEAFWVSVDTSIPKHFADWPRVVLTDANCRLGSLPCERIGSWQAESMTEKSEPFAQFVVKSNVFLPATFEKYHIGESGTWQHQLGMWKRNDFIGIPCDWPIQSCTSWIPDNVDFSIAKEDHRTVCAECSWTEFAHDTDLRLKKRLKASLHDFCPEKLSEYAWFARPDFTVDVHTDAVTTQAAIMKCRKKRTPTQLKPRKETLSPQTWELICAKKYWRKALHDNTCLRKATLQAMFFAAWRHSRGSNQGSFQYEEFDRLICHQDQLIAIALFNFQKLGREVTRAIRKDDQAFFESLTRDASEFLAPNQIKDFWKTIRRHLPKFRNRKLGHDPNRIEVLQDQWVPYFQALEIGSTREAIELTRTCHARQMNMPIAQQVFQVADLPSLIELEDVIRSTQPDRSTGLDPVPSGLFRQNAVDLAQIYFPLMLKQCLWQSEPLLSKGGQMAVIHKKGSTAVAENYRGIMLLPTFAKRFHALIRVRLMERLRRQRPQGQIGGFANMQVPFGSQMLQVFGRIMDSQGHSSAIVFFDLTNAFHRLIRELVSGIHVPDAIEEVLQAVAKEGIPAQEVVKLLELPHLLQQLNAPPFLIQLLQDLHTDTWLQAPGDSRFIVTRRGTRPGSPLADCIFHILMADVTKEINHWMADQAEFQGILADTDIEIESVVWADDLALPLATRQAHCLPALIEASIQHVHQVFLRRGFLLNLSKGKTSVVATFKGAGAAELRRMYQLSDRPGFTIQLGTQEAFIHFVAHYKHLGTIYSSSHSLDIEIATRIGLARSAFAQLASPVLCNRHLPTRTRLQMYRALVETRLFFGLGAWAPLTVRQNAKLQAAILYMLKRVLRLTQEEHESLTTADVFQRAGQCCPRARIALDRLLYAQKVWQHGPSMLQHLLHREEALLTESWMYGLKHDLAWLHSLEPDAPPRLEPGSDLTEVFDFWQAGSRQWRVRVKRAWRRYQQQEGMTNSLIGLHKSFFKILLQHGSTFQPNPFETLEKARQEFVCHCGRAFSTAQGLACHKRHKHKEYSLEHGFLVGETCPACLKFFWTKQRLYLHLAYVPRRTGVNKCFQILSQQGFQCHVDGQQFQTKPIEVRGLARVEAVQAQGPLKPCEDHRTIQIQQIQNQLDGLTADLQTVGPPDMHDVSASLHLALSQATESWFQQFQDDGFDESLAEDLPNRWIALLGDAEGHFGPWYEAEFMKWGQDQMPEVLAEFMDGRAEILVDDAFCELVSIFPRFEMVQRQTLLRAKLRLLTEEIGIHFPHRAVRKGSANTQERAETAASVPMRFDEQQLLFQHVRAIKWLDLPRDCKVPIWRQPQEKPIFLIAHLFSGRRRVGDVHTYLLKWAAEANLQVLVLSLDTANSETMGNLHVSSVTWAQLTRLYREGRIAATLAGAPCETWSAARHHPLNADGNDGETPRSGPRPLRSAERIFGLKGLTPREMRQLSQGTHFYLQTTITIAWSICTGGLYISEHPAPPEDKEIASVWTAPWTELLRLHPDVALHVMSQWKWGCAMTKPTGFLTLRMARFAQSMYRRQLPDAKRPSQVAIGKGPDGQFMTSALKEYPEPFCAALAGAIIDELQKRNSSHLCATCAPPDPDLVQWVGEAEALCGRVRAEATWLPDYQGR